MVVQVWLKIFLININTLYKSCGSLAVRATSDAMRANSKYFWQEIVTLYLILIGGLVGFVYGQRHYLGLTDEWFTASVIASWVQALGTVSAVWAAVMIGKREHQRALATEKTKSKDDLAKEARATNAAIALTHDILQTYLASKDQQVAPLKVSYDREMARYNLFKASLGRDQEAQLLPSTRLDFEILPNSIVPIEQLQNIIFNDLSITGRALALFGVLTKVILALQFGTERRNQLIGEYKKNQPHDSIGTVAFYFGEQDADGNIDKSYPQTIDEIYNKTDDCIYFSKLLHDDLAKHGRELIKIFKDKNKNSEDIPKLIVYDFLSVPDGLIPPAENYADWNKEY